MSESAIQERFLFQNHIPSVVFPNIKLYAKSLHVRFHMTTSTDSFSYIYSSS